MSQSATRASAREIRRAFGPSAVQHLDALEQRLTSAEAAIGGSHVRMEAIYDVCMLADQARLSEIAALAVRMHEAEQIQKSHKADIRSLSVFSSRSVIERLRWLLTGR